MRSSLTSTRKPARSPGTTGGTRRTPFSPSRDRGSSRRRRARCGDLDPQASAKSWYDRRDKENPVVISAQAAALTEVLATAATHGADYAIIDTAPHSETAALTAGRAADLILIPCRASYVDLKAIEITVDLVKLAKKPAMFVLSCIRPGDKTLPNGAESHLAQYPIPVSPQRITQRAAVVHTLTAGQTISEFEPEGAAAREIGELFRIASTHVVV